MRVGHILNNNNSESHNGSIDEVLLLQNQINQIQHEIDHTELETWVYDTYYEQHCNEVSKDEEQDNNGRKKKRIPRPAAPITLNVQQKYTIANAIQDHVNDDISSKRVSSEKLVDTLRAVLEETELRIEDLKREAFEFKRAIVISGENPRTGAISGDKVKRYYDDRNKTKDVMLEKLRLKNSTMKLEINKNEKKLSLLDEAGEVLHYIDFHQLQIENKQNIRKIEEKDVELEFVKSSTAKCVRILTEAKRDLTDAISSRDQMRKDVKSHGEHIEILIEESNKIRKYARDLEKRNKEIKRQLLDARPPPDVNEYISQRRMMYRVENDMKTWQKRVGLGKQGLINSKQKKRAALRELGVNNSNNNNILRTQTR